MPSLTDIHRRFLCACLRHDHTQARALAQTPGWSWERLIHTASDECVLPALPGKIQDAPSDVSDFLSGVEYLSAERNRAIFDELKTAAHILNQAGIQPVLLKGIAYLAARVYSHPAERYLVDVDLLIAPEQSAAAVEILAQNGFASDETDAFGRFRHHHPPLRRPGSISFELHHSLGLGTCGAILPVREVIERSTSLDLDGAQVRLPCPEHLMTHLILHSQLQHPYQERIWPPLRALYDLVRLQHRFAGSINWTGIENRFRRAGQYGLFVLHLLDVRDALGLELPIELHLSLLTRLRHLRRKFLRRFPALRYLDPIYMLSTVFTRRLRVLRNMLRTPGGLKHLLSQLLKLPVYQRFFVDLLEGRGR